MSNEERALSGRTENPDVPIEGSRVVSPDYGMPGTKGLESPIKPLLWLLIPFLFCLGYGIMTR